MRATVRILQGEFALGAWHFCPYLVISLMTVVIKTIGKIKHSIFWRD